MAKSNAATDAFRTALGNVQGEVDNLRSEIRKLQAERDNLRNGMLNPDEAVAYLGRVIDGVADDYLDSIQGDLGAICRGEPAAFSPFTGLDQFGRKKSAAIGLICLLLNTEMKERLAELIQNVPGLSAMRAEERQKRVKVIDAELLKLERAEEALINDAEGAGLDIPRRPDADPAAVLGL